MSLISIDSYPVKDVLHILLEDKTTKKNIIFATKTYEELGYEYTEHFEITLEKLKGMQLMPRIEKETEAQKYRTKVKAEVMTPSWLCNQMNNHCDEEWFGRENVFNTQTGDIWTTSSEKITFPAGLCWKDYVDSRRIEITCGEAPYIVSRYDTTTGQLIPVYERIGLLDRKLRIVNENAGSREEWFKWVERAFQSVYGFEYQGDNLLIARINLLSTFVEYVKERWGEVPDIKGIKRIANIIAWNFWQMDGITSTIPYGNPHEEYQQLTLFDGILFGEKTVEETPVCRIFDWRSKESIRYTDIKKGR